MPVSKKVKKSGHSKKSSKPLVEFKVPEVLLKSSSSVIKPKLSILPVIFRILVAVVLIIGSLAFYQLAFVGRIYPGVAVGQFNLSGKTLNEAEEILKKAWLEFTNKGVVLKLNQQSVVLTNLVTSPSDPDLTYQLFYFDPTEAAQQAYIVGRQGNWFSKLVSPLIISFKLSSVSRIKVEVEPARVVQYIRDNFPGVEQVPQPARLQVDLAGNLSVQSEVNGLVIDEDDLFNQLSNRLVNLNTKEIEVKMKVVAPALNQTMVARVLPEARNMLTDRNLVFYYKDKTWQADPQTWHQWLGAELNEQTNKVSLSFVSDQTDEFFQTIEQAVNQPARNAKFEVRNGRVAAFQSSWQGREVDRQETLARAFLALKNNNTEPIEMVVITTEPEVTTEETNELGISEIIGIGHSNFKGSPANRRHNIKVGAEALNGLLIKPGEEFSLLKALLPVDATTGYLPELVIKGNRTIPEYGGGLCQIGTTIFRATLNSGLPIITRRNHSYRVVYYEPAGTDATIYDPAPDYKFKNDTNSTILIQTRIEGDDLYFEFWGRPDGRKAEQTKPRIYNIVPPPPTKIIETEDLEPGVKKCTEKPHSGADAEFTYTVTYPNGEVKQEVFKSHYIPWQEVCLVGVSKGIISQPQAENPEGTLPNSIENQTENSSLIQ